MGFEVKVEEVEPLRARRLRNARSRSGLSASQAARLMEISVLAYVQLEQGSATMTEDEWDRAIDLVGIKQ